MKHTVAIVASPTFGYLENECKIDMVNSLSINLFQHAQSKHFWLLSLPTTIVLLQKRNAITIQYSIAEARQKELRSGINVNEYLDTCRIANVYFTSDVDAKLRIRDLNEYDEINLNKIGRTSVYDDDGIFKYSQHSGHDFDEV